MRPEIWIFIFSLCACLYDGAHANSKFVASYDAYGNFAELKEMEQVIRGVVREHNLKVKVWRSPGLPPDPEHSMPADYLYPLFSIADNFPISEGDAVFSIAIYANFITILGEASAPRVLPVRFAKELEKRFDLTFETKPPLSEESLSPVCGKNRTFVASFDAYGNFSMFKEIEDTIRIVAGRNGLKVKVLQSHGLPPDPEDESQGFYRYPEFLIAEDFEDWASKKITGFCIQASTHDISIWDKTFTSLTLINQFTEELRNQFNIVFDVAPYDRESTRHCFQRCRFK